MIFLLLYRSIFPEYYEVIKKPMDLTSMKENFNKYETVEEVLVDLRQIWENCRLFNAEGSDISATADMMDIELEGLVEVRTTVYFHSCCCCFKLFLYFCCQFDYFLLYFDFLNILLINFPRFLFLQLS